MIRWLKWGGILLLAAGVLTAIAVAVGRRSPELPNPNGWDRLVALASQIPPGEVLSLDASGPDSTAQFVATHSNLLSQIQEALELPSRVPVAHNSADIGRHMNGLATWPFLEKCLLAVARQRDTEQNPMGGIKARAAVIKLGQRGIHGGSVMDYMVGVPIQINGLRELTNNLAQMNSNSCHVVIGEVRVLRNAVEPLADYVARTRRWMLLNGNWWRDWTTAKELSRLLVSLESQPGGNGKTPRACSEELDATFAQVEAALIGRLAELTRQNGGALGR